MNLYLLRHGQAEPNRVPDAARSLTDAGKQEIANVAAEFSARGITLAACYYSPLVRTTETCQLFLQGANQTLVPESLQLLTHEHRASEVLGFLQQVRAEEVLLVTHNPLVSELLAVLTDTPIDSMHVFTTGELNALACTDCSRGGATWRFSLHGSG